MKKSNNANRRNPVYVLISLGVLVILGTAGLVHATLLASPGVIIAPEIIADDPPGATNDRQQAFDERQGVKLVSDQRCSNAIIPAGEVVNSHMIFFNTRFDGIETDADRTWTFEEEIICVMAETSGLLQGTTDSIFGAPGTNYPGVFSGRGLETDGIDRYSINGNEITVTMRAEEPGDWIRVLTKVAVPADTTAPTVFCEPGASPGDQNNNKETNPFYALIGSDETDGMVDLYLTDTVSETTFGPFAPGTNVKIQTAKGATPEQSAGQGAIDYTIKVNGSTRLSATDEAGNEGTAICSQK